MPVLSRLAVLLLIGLSTASLAGAAQRVLRAKPAEQPRHVELVHRVQPPHRTQPAHRACLTKAEQRAAVASRRAISLGQAIKSARIHRKKKAEVVRARLCRRGDRLVYELTLLAANGKVTRAAVDAANGALIKGRAKSHETAASGEKRLAPPRRRGRSRP